MMVQGSTVENTTNNVVQYLLLRLHVSALSLGHHQVSNCASEETIHSPPRHNLRHDDGRNM